MSDSPTEDYVGNLNSFPPHLFNRATIKVILFPFTRVSDEIYKVFPRSFIVEEILPLDKNVLASISPKSLIFLDYETITDPLLLDSSVFHTFAHPLAILGIISEEITIPIEELRNKYDKKYKETVSTLKKKFPHILTDRCIFIQNEKSVLISPERPSSAGERFRFIINRSHDHLEACLSAELEDLSKELIQALVAIISQLERKQQQQSMNMSLLSTLNSSQTSNTLSGSVATLPPYNELVEKLTLPFEENNNNFSVYNAVIAEEMFLKRDSVSSMSDSIHEETLERSTSLTSITPDPLTEDLKPVRGSSFVSSNKGSTNLVINKSRAISLAAADHLSGISSPLNTFSEQMKEKKKYPGRIQKRLGELYLLSGCWSKASQCFLNVVEIMKKLDDYAFHVNSIEGYLCSQALLKDFSCLDGPEFIEKQEELFLLIEEKLKDPLIRIETCLRFSCFYTRAAVLKNNSELKIRASQMIMKVWSSGIEDLVLMDQARVAGYMRHLFQMLEYPRKEAFFARQTALLLLPHLMELLPQIIHQQDQALKKSKRPQSSKTSASSYQSPTVEVNPNGFEFTDSIPESSTEIYDMTNYKNQCECMIELLLKSLSVYRNDHQKSKYIGKFNPYNPKNGNYWKILFIDVLKEGIRMTEMIQEFNYTALLTGILLEDSIQSDLDAELQAKIFSTILKNSEKLTYRPSDFTFPNKFPVYIQSSDLSRFTNIKILPETNIFVSRLVKSFDIGNLQESANKNFLGKIIVTSKNDENDQKIDNGLFLYDSISKKEGPTVNENSKKVQSLSYIVRNESFTVSAIMNNPLKCDILIKDFALVLGCGLDLDLTVSHRHTELSGGSQVTVIWNVTVLFDPKKHEKISTETLEFVLQGMLIKFSNGWVEYVKVKETKIPILLNFPPILKLISTNLIRNTELILFEGEESEIMFYLDLIPESGRSNAKLDFLEVKLSYVYDENDRYGFVKSNCLNDFLFESNLYDQVPCIEFVGAFDDRDQPITYPFVSASYMKSCVNLKFKSLGKRNVVGANITLFYGLLDHDKRYTRTFSLNLNIKVVNPLEILNVDITRYHDPRSFENYRGNSIEEIDVKSREVENSSNMCLLIIDIKNNWKSMFQVRFCYGFQLFSTGDYFTNETGKSKEPFQTIYPNQTKRFLIPVRRISKIEIDKCLENLSQDSSLYFIEKLPYDPLLQEFPPIPIYRKRIPMTGKLTHEDTFQKYSRLISEVEKKLKKGVDGEELEQCRREFLNTYINERFHRFSFYFKHHLLKTRMFSLEWKQERDQTNQRQGKISLRPFTSLNDTDLIYLREPLIDIKTEVYEGERKIFPSVDNIFMITKGEKISFNFCLNFEGKARSCLLRVQNFYENKGEICFDFDERYVLNGSLQAVLNKNKEEHEIEARFYANGIYKFIYFVEDLEDYFRNESGEVWKRLLNLFGENKVSSVTWCEEPLVFCVK